MGDKCFAEESDLENNLSLSFGVGVLTLVIFSNLWKLSKIKRYLFHKIPSNFGHHSQNKKQNNFLREENSQTPT